MSKTITNEQGGSQSFIEADFDCIPPEVLKLLAECLGFGARKYGKGNWKKIPMPDNLNHTMNHINEWRRGDRSEPHLVNAMARLTFALFQAVDLGQQPDRYIHPDMLKDTQAELAEKPSGNWAHEMALPEPAIKLEDMKSSFGNAPIKTEGTVPPYAPVKTDFEVRLEKVEKEQRLHVETLDTLCDRLDEHENSLKFQRERRTKIELSVSKLQEQLHKIGEDLQAQTQSLDKMWESITNTQRSVESIAFTTNKSNQGLDYRIN